MNLKRTILERMERDTLKEVVIAFELAGVDRRSREEMVAALAKARRVTAEDLLAYLREGEVKALCEVWGVSQTGRRNELIARLLGAQSDAPPAQNRRTSRAKESTRTTVVEAYEHTGKERLNNPPVGLVTPETDPDAGEKRTYAYDPHLDPQLVWAGKAEHTSFEVPTVSLHVHERIDPRTILEAVRKKNGQPQPVQLGLFEQEREEPLREAIEFYRHKHGWSNRLIAGDSLLVMNSLLEKEGLAGKVQMIYIDPPYGIKYGSNFQPFVNRRDVKDGKDEDLTAEPEQIKAFRDTWELGIHSYLTYLRDRLLLARELLTESGSIFVQISDENVHRVRCLMDEVFGAENFVALIPFRKKTMPLGTKFIEQMSDFLLWYAKQKTDSQGRPICKYRKLFRPMAYGPDSGYNFCVLPNGSRLKVNDRTELSEDLRKEIRWFTSKSLEPSGPMESGKFNFAFEGVKFDHPKNGYGTSIDGLKRLALAGRLIPSGKLLRYVLFADDKAWGDLTVPWHDTIGASNKEYVVQTSTDVITRCLLMTTDPGDLVFDPTCLRKGTGVWAPLNPPVNGGTSSPSPLTGRAGVGPSSPISGTAGVGLLPIEAIQPGDLVLGHDGKPHRVLRTIRKPYQGTMVGIQHSDSTQTLWVTADHYVLCQKRTRSYGAGRTWRHVPGEHFDRARALRREMTPAERQLWSDLRGEQLGVKFRKQHPIGPYIADFYSWEAGLVIEVDGNSHFTPEAQDYDHERDNYLSALGLTVLRFSNQEVASQKEGVLSRIVEAIEAVKPSEDHYKQWRRADSLQAGDVVYFGPEQRPVEIANLLYEETQEEVYDLEVEGVHSFLTEVCAVHNCGSGTTAYVAEQWGWRWIIAPLSSPGPRTTIWDSKCSISSGKQCASTARTSWYDSPMAKCW